MRSCRIAGYVAMLAFWDPILLVARGETSQTSTRSQFVTTCQSPLIASCPEQPRALEPLTQRPKRQNNGYELAMGAQLGYQGKLATLQIWDVATFCCPWSTGRVIPIGYGFGYSQFGIRPIARP